MAPEMTVKTTGDAPKGELNGQKSFNLSASAQSPALFDGKGDVIPMYRNCSGLLYFDWLWRFWAYFDTPAHGVSWYCAYGFFLGAVFFILGSFAAVVPSVYNSEVTGNCMGDPYDWWVNFTYMAGILVWQPAVYLQMVEALNTDIDARIMDWEESGRQGPKPRYKWWGLKLMGLDWWGATFYTVGVALYICAIASTIINDCPNTLYSPVEYLWLVDIAYIIGGWLFGFAGLFYCMAEISMKVYPAIIPLSWRDFKSMKWHGMWWYHLGGWCFAAGGMQLIWDSPVNAVEPLWTYNIIEAVTFGGGTTCFFIGAILFLARQSRGRCKPSYGVVGRLDPTTRAGPQASTFRSGKPAPADSKV